MAPRHGFGIRFYRIFLIPRLFASRQSNRGNARGRCSGFGLDIIPDEPERALVRRIERDVRVILPAQAAGLRRFSLGQRRFVS